MRFLVFGFAMLFGFSLCAMDENGSPDSFWNRKGAEKVQAPVKKNEYNALIARLCGYEKSQDNNESPKNETSNFCCTAECDRVLEKPNSTQKDGEALIACFSGRESFDDPKNNATESEIRGMFNETTPALLSITVSDRSASGEKNQSNTSATNSPKRILSPMNGATGLVVTVDQADNWQDFFSESEEEASNDFMITKRPAGQKNGCDYLPPFTCVRVWASECEPRMINSGQRKRKSSFEPHRLFELLRTNVHILAPYYKSSTSLTPLEAYIAVSWLKRYRTIFLDSQREGCCYCSPATVLKGCCCCPIISNDQARIDRLKMKIAMVVGAVQQFVTQTRDQAPIAYESNRCDWHPVEDGSQKIPEAVKLLAKRAREQLKISFSDTSNFKMMRTGYEADDETQFHFDDDGLPF
jgi:hypothetical protein